MDFYKYYFQTHYTEKIFFPFGEGVHYQYRWGIGTETLKNFPIVIPPKHQQDRIVSFLDKKTMLINELIHESQKKVVLNKERKQSLISETVTKGLDKNVKLNTSGYEWIGTIPELWKIKRLCYMFKVTSIKNNTGEKYLSVYRDYGVIPRDSRDDNHNVLPDDTSDYKLVEVGDFVMNKMKCWSGSLGLSDYRGLVSPSYTVMKPLTENNRKYLHYLLRSGLHTTI